MKDPAHNQHPNGNSNSQEATLALSAEAPAVLEFAPGIVILERYKVIEMLGRGGMGSVYKVESLETALNYALKFLHKQHTNEATWRRFDIEAKTSNKLDHPNLIKVYEWGLLPDGQPFFIMDLVQGESLADILKTRGRLSVSQAVKVFIQVGFALSYAHANGVIHRDIKPSNIMLEKNKDDTTIGAIVKVVDFGIAKLTGKDDCTQMTLTKTGEIFGSPLYMSPEQCMGAGVDHRSDLYSLGCVFYESLTGAPPLMGDSALSTMMKHQSEDALPLKEASLGIEYPEQIERIIARLLKKEVHDRYQTAQAFTSDLVNFDSGLDTTFPVFDKVEPKVETKIRPFYVFKLLSIYLGILLVGAFIGTRIPRPAPEIPKVRLYADNALSRTPTPNMQIKHEGGDIVDEYSPAHFKMCHARLSAMEKEAGYFATLDGKRKIRIFHFPDFSLGVIGETYGKPQKAKGSIEFPISAHLAFTPNGIFKSHPKLFKKFREDEIEWLSLKNQYSDINIDTIDYSSTDNLLSQATHLRTLKELHMNATEVSPKGWQCVNTFANLKVLSLSHIKLSAAEIAKFKGFKKLEYFKLVTDESVTPVIERLKGSKEIRNLCLSRCAITDKDAEAFATMPMLTELELRGTKITDETIKKLPNTLRLLDISKCKVTSASFPYFKHLKNLRLLIVDRESFSSFDIHKLLSSNQNLEVEFAITEEEKHTGRLKPARVSNEQNP